MTRRVAVRNTTRDCLLAQRAEVATTLLQRALGLIGRRDWAGGDGLVIEPCSAVHTLFMRLPIDVVYVGAEGRVLQTVRKLEPWRIGPVVLGSHWVLELPAGTTKQEVAQVGDRLELLGSRPTDEQGGREEMR